LRLEYKESWVATLQLLFLLCKVSLTKLFEMNTAEVEPAVFISASRLEVVASFSGHPSSGYGSYRLRSALYTLKYAMK